ICKSLEPGRTFYLSITIEMKLAPAIARTFASLYTSLRETRLGLTIFALTGIYLVAFAYVRKIAALDPGSYFFDPIKAYQLQYTTVREEQAENYINTASTAPPFRRNTDGADLQMCVGVPSIARGNTRYLRSCIGSLLEGLSQNERDGMHLAVFIPHTDPTLHPALHEPWLANSADDVLLYNLTQSELDHVKALEEGKKYLIFKEKGLFDYIYLLKACYATGAPNIVMLEDDVLAMDGWYHRTLRGLEQAAAVARRKSSTKDFLYLRLFYTEKFFGWNSEDWYIHTFWSLLTIGLCGLSLVLIRIGFPSTQRSLTNPVVMAVCTIPVPLAIILFFAAGKLTALPFSTGVNVMNNYGCCSQAMVYPRPKALELMNWYQKNKVGFVDQLTEEYADEQAQLRLAMNPVVFQHVGSKSSKSDDFGQGSPNTRTLAQMVWNIAFEWYRADNLREEHRLAENAM
ncbi:hypothetical protein LTR56_026333, partial [Elasticomyces elasticus]